jgi:DNA repair protein RadD
MASRVKLRGYQEETLEALRECFRQGHRVVMLYAPTGAGKTEMAMSLLEHSNDKGNRSAMLLDRIVLCNQTSARLDRYGMDHGVMQAGHWRQRGGERIQVCSAQTLEKRGSFPGLKLLVVDEAHSTRAKTREFIENNKDVMVVGLSASPFAKGLASLYTAVVGATTTERLVQAGNLAPLKVFIAKEIDVALLNKNKAGEFVNDQKMDAAAIQLAGDTVEIWRTKCQEVFGGPVKTIVFSAGVAHGAELVRRFAEAGYNFVQISYEDSDDFKTEAVKDFSRPDTNIHGLIACDILTKGFDVPDVKCGISARPFKKSFSSHVQQMGRPMRTAPGKDFAMWICQSGNYLRFQSKWDELYHHGVDHLEDDGEKAVEERTPQEKERAKCPKCGALWSGRGRICGMCGHQRPIFNTVAEVKAEVVELEKAGIPLAEKQRWYAELRAIVAARGKPDGMAAYVYKDKFGIMPPLDWNRQPVASEVSPEVAGFEQHRRIAFAKGKARGATRKAA